MKSQRLTILGLVTLTIVVVSCRDKKSAVVEGMSGAVVAGDGVIVAVDGKVVGTLSSSTDFDAPLSRLLPRGAANPDKWRRLEALSRQGQQLHIDDFATSYPTHVVRVFLDAKNRPSIGLFPERNKGEEASTKPILQIVNLMRIDVSTVIVKSEKIDRVAVTIRLPNGKSRAIRESALQALAISGRGGNNKRLKGWKLVDVLAIGNAAEPIEFKTLRAQGTTADDQFEIERTALEGEGILARLKRNNRGLLRMRVFQTNGGKDGDKQPDILHQITDLKELTLSN